MPSNTGRLTPREQALEKLDKLQRAEIEHFLRTGEPPTPAPERLRGTQRGGGAKDAADS